MGKIKAIPWKEIFYDSEHAIKLLPVIGYAVFGILNIIFFSFAMRKIPASTAFAVWLSVAMVAAKVIDVAVFKEHYSGVQVFFILLILVGVIGLKIYGE